jgi:uncharacterized membrane protein
MKGEFVGARLPKIIFVLLAAYAVFHFWSYYAQLPDVMASHFDARGIANGWQSKSAFFSTFIMVGVLAVVLGLGLPRIITRLPAQFINLPNKQYWLSPEHAAETQEYLITFFAWFGCALFVVLITAFDFALQSNLHPENRPDIFRLWMTLAGFLAFVVAWTIRMMAKFLHPPQ